MCIRDRARIVAEALDQAADHLAQPVLQVGRRRRGPRQLMAAVVVDDRRLDARPPDVDRGNLGHARPPIPRAPTAS